jgi:hypothetical protein
VLNSVNIYSVMYMTTSRQQLGKHIPEIMLATAE